MTEHNPETTGPQQPSQETADALEQAEAERDEPEEYPGEEYPGDDQATDTNAAGWADG